MAYCRNCRAQLKTAQICPVCGTERIPSKKRLLRRKKLPLPDAKNGAESLRAGLREGSTLLLLIAGLALVSSVLALITNLSQVAHGDFFAGISALIALLSLLLPAGLYLLWKEKDKKGDFSPTGLRLIVGHEICGIVYMAAFCLYAMHVPVGNDGGSFVSTMAHLLTSGFWSMIIPALLMLLFTLLLFGIFFGVIILWVVAGIRICKNTIILTKENKRFRVPKYFEIGLLIVGGISILGPFSSGKELLPALTSFATAAGYLLKYALLVRVKKHI